MAKKVKSYFDTICGATIRVLCISRQKYQVPNDPDPLHTIFLLPQKDDKGQNSPRFFLFHLNLPLPSLAIPFCLDDRWLFGSCMLVVLLFFLLCGSLLPIKVLFSST